METHRRPPRELPTFIPTGVHTTSTDTLGPLVCTLGLEVLGVMDLTLGDGDETLGLGLSMLGLHPPTHPGYSPVEPSFRTTKS